MKKLKVFVVFAAAVVAFGAAFALVTNVVEAHTRTVKIRVDKNGFSPSSFEVEAGHKLNLVFNRVDKDNCGGTVVLPRYKIRKALPVGKEVIVTIVPKAAGTISFTCGMGMMKGNIVVTD